MAGSARGDMQADETLDGHDTETFHQWILAEHPKMTKQELEAIPLPLLVELFADVRPGGANWVKIVLLWKGFSEHLNDPEVAPLLLDFVLHSFRPGKNLDVKNSNPILWRGWLHSSYNQVELHSNAFVSSTIFGQGLREAKQMSDEDFNTYQSFYCRSAYDLAAELIMWHRTEADDTTVAILEACIDACRKAEEKLDFWLLTP